MHTDHRTSILKAPASIAMINRKVSTTVLVIDDDDLARELLQGCLTKIGYQVIVAESGVVALGLVQNGTPEFELAIIDFDMPGMDGIRTFEALRLLIPNLRAVLYTGNPDLVRLQRKCPAGLVCKAKDFRPQKVQTLMKHLEKRV